MEFLGLKFKNPPGSNLCYSNACVNGLLASQTLMSKVNHDHGSMYQGQSCGICYFFSYYKRLNLFQSNEPDSTEALKNRMAQKAKQFIGNRQQDPVEYIEEILGQCSIFKQLTSLEVVHTYTCIS